jgi:5'-phosphate synthase pdxT subunit
LVRAPSDIEGLTHLVLPGGESTTLRHLLVLFGLWEPIRARNRAGELALFGTCAGAILLARGPQRPPTFGLLDAVVERNAYGTQRDSFRRTLDAVGAPFPGVFIRAPRFTAIGEGTRVLGRLDGEPALLEGPGLLAASFHPELTEDARLHAHFLTLRFNARVSPASARCP